MSDLIVKYSTFNNEGTEIKHKCTIEEAANQLAKMDKLYNDQLKEIRELKMQVEDIKKMGKLAAGLAEIAKGKWDKLLKENKELKIERDHFDNQAKGLIKTGEANLDQVIELKKGLEIYKNSHKSIRNINDMISEDFIRGVELLGRSLERNKEKDKLIKELKGQVAKLNNEKGSLLADLCSAMNQAHENYKNHE